jgi:hypothetical protein
MVNMVDTGRATELAATLSVSVAVPEGVEDLKIAWVSDADLNSMMHRGGKKCCKARS